MRHRFEQQLELLGTELITMGALCEEAIAAAAKSLLHSDEALRQSIHTIEEAIDQKERDIESLCLKLLLCQQPVASDLRTISSALKMISDMERIGDQAADIADIVPYLQGKDIVRQVPIEKMATLTIAMVKNCVDSFVRHDLTLARAVSLADDEVDALFTQIKKELIALIPNSDHGEECLDLLMIAKYFERIGDHAVNVSEWVEFSITGLHIDK